MTTQGRGKRCVSVCVNDVCLCVCVCVCVCAQSSSLADDSTLTRASPSARTQAGPHGLLPNPQLIYSAIGPSEGYVSPMGPYPGGPTWTKNKYLREGGDRM